MPGLATAVHRVFTSLTNIVLLYHAMHLIHDYFSDIKEEQCKEEHEEEEEEEYEEEHEEGHGEEHGEGHEGDEEVCKELYEICVKHRKKFLHVFGEALKKL